MCVEEIIAKNRLSTHFTKKGWKNVQQKFHERTSHNYDKTQLKNRWDALRRKFTSFAKMVEKETGLGWDHEKKTIQAPEEWWIEKARYVGVNLYDIIFFKCFVCVDLFILFIYFSNDYRRIQRF